MVAVKLAAVSVVVPSVKLATSVVPASAVPSVALTRSNWPDRLFAMMSSLAPATRQAIFYGRYQPDDYRDTVVLFYDNRQSQLQRMKIISQHVKWYLVPARKCDRARQKCLAWLGAGVTSAPA
jgi:hypothetical protein